MTWHFGSRGSVGRVSVCWGVLGWDPEGCWGLWADPEQEDGALPARAMGTPALPAWVGDSPAEMPGGSLSWQNPGTPFRHLHSLSPAALQCPCAAGTGVREPQQGLGTFCCLQQLWGKAVLARPLGKQL